LTGEQLLRPQTLDLSVVIPSYNTCKLIERALRTVTEASKDLDVEIIVVDNASNDGSQEMIEEKFPGVRLIKNDNNLGFAGANNMAFRQSEGRHVLLLNSDTLVRPDTLRCLVEFLDTHPEAGAVGCKILNPDGTFQHDCRRGFPTPMAAIYKLSGLSRLFRNNPRFARYNLTYLDPDELSEVDALSGSCMMVRRQVLEQVGFLDEDYFMYGEDLDWCFRMRQGGWRIYYVPTTTIIHFRGRSGHRQKMRVQYRKNEAMAIFVRKHMKDRYRIFPTWILHLGILMYGVYSFARPLAQKLALPLVDAVLVLSSLKLGIVLRYHEKLTPVIRHIETTGTRFDLGFEPTRWLELPAYSDTQWLVVYAVSTALWLLAFSVCGLYDKHKYSPLRAVLAVSMGFAFVVTTVFFFKAYNFSRLAAGAAWFFSTILIAGWRAGSRLPMHPKRSRRMRRRKVIVIGTDADAERLLEYLHGVGGLDCDLLGIVAAKNELVGRVVADVQVVGAVEDLAEIVNEYGADELLFTSHTIAHTLPRVGHSFASRHLRLRIIPTSFHDLIDADPVQSLDDLPLVDVSG
jgi:GT2 family glycosyltransferase